MQNIKKYLIGFFLLIEVMQLNAKNKLLIIENFCASGQTITLEINRTFRVRHLPETFPGECGIAKMFMGCHWVVYDKRDRQHCFNISTPQSNDTFYYKYDSLTAQSIMVDNLPAKIIDFQFYPNNKFNGRRVFIYGASFTLIIDFDISNYKLVLETISKMKIRNYNSSCSQLGSAASRAEGIK